MLLTLWTLVSLKEKIVAGAFVAVIAGALWFGHHERNVGRDEQKAEYLAVKARVESVTVVKLDSVVRVDTVRLTRSLAHYDTVRSVLNVHDTIAVERFVATADSTVRACRETVSAFALSCAAKDTLITTLRQQLTLRLPPASGGASWRERAAWALAGGVAGRYIHP